LNFLNINNDELPGINVLDKEASEKRETLFIECYNHDILNVEKPSETVLYKVALNKKWKLMVPNPNMVVRSYDTPEEQYQGYYSNKTQLFDLENDPNEQNNVAEKYPQIVEEMSRRIEEWWQPI